MRRLQQLLAATLVAVAVMASGIQPASADTNSDEIDFVVRINQLRASQGLRPLDIDSRLRDIARGWAQQMANAGQISHNPNYSNQAPSEWSKIGENVGVGPNVPSLHQAFVDSPGHYRNLVDTQFHSVGIGVVYANGRLWVAEQFMFVAPVATVQVKSGSITAAAKQPVATTKKAKGKKKAKARKPARPKRRR